MDKRYLTKYDPNLKKYVPNTEFIQYAEYNSKGSVKESDVPALYTSYSQNKYRAEREAKGLKLSDSAIPSWYDPAGAIDDVEQFRSYLKKNKLSAYVRDVPSYQYYYNQYEAEKNAVAEGLKSKEQAFEQEQRTKTLKETAGLYGVSYDEGDTYLQWDPSYEKYGYTYSYTEEDRQRKAMGLPPQSFIDEYGGDKDSIKRGKVPKKIENTTELYRQYQEFTNELSRRASSKTLTEDTAIPKGRYGDSGRNNAGGTWQQADGNQDRLEAILVKYPMLQAFYDRSTSSFSAPILERYGITPDSIAQAYKSAYAAQQNGTAVAQPRSMVPQSLEDTRDVGRLSVATPKAPVDRVQPATVNTPAQDNTAPRSRLAKAKLDAAHEVAVAEREAAAAEQEARSYRMGNVDKSDTPEYSKTVDQLNEKATEAKAKVAAATYINQNIEAYFAESMVPADADKAVIEAGATKSNNKMASSPAYSAKTIADLKRNVGNTGDWASLNYLEGPVLKENLSNTKIDPQVMGVMLLTQKQRDNINYLYGIGADKEADNLFNLYRESAAQAWTQYLSSETLRELTVKESDTLSERNVKKARGLLNALYATLPAVAYAGEIVGTTIQNVATGENKPAPESVATAQLRVAQAGQQSVSEGMGPVPKFVTDGLVSALQNVPAYGLNLLVPGAGLAAMATSAAGQTGLQAKDSGATGYQQFGLAAASGLTEWATERIPLEQFPKIIANARGLVKGNIAKEAQQSAVKQFILSSLKQMGTEGTEEGISNIAGNLADIAIMGDKSAYARYIASQKRMGKSQDAAVKAANLQFFVMDTLRDAGLGAISGLAFGIGGNVIGAIDGTAASDPAKAALAKVMGGQDLTQSEIDRFLPMKSENRKAFTEVTGVELPNDVRGTRQVISEVVRQKQSDREAADTGASVPVVDELIDTPQASSTPANAIAESGNLVDETADNNIDETDDEDIDDNAYDNPNIQHYTVEQAKARIIEHTEYAYRGALIDEARRQGVALPMETINTSKYKLVNTKNGGKKYVDDPYSFNRVAGGVDVLEPLVDIGKVDPSDPYGFLFFRNQYYDSLNGKYNQNDQYWLDDIVEYWRRKATRDARSGNAQVDTSTAKTAPNTGATLESNISTPSASAPVYGGVSGTTQANANTETAGAPTNSESRAGRVLNFKQGKGNVTVKTISQEARQMFTDNERHTMKTLERTGRQLGVNVQWAYSISHEEGGSRASDNGMYDPETDTLYISFDSATADGGAPYVAILGHEIAHSLEGTQAYNTILQYAVQQSKGNGTYDKKMESLRKAYPDRTELYLQQELVSDVVQNVFNDKAELRRLVNSQRGVVGAILNAIDTILSKLKGRNAELSKLRTMLQDALNEKQDAKGEAKSMRRLPEPTTYAVDLSTYADTMYRETNIENAVYFVDKNTSIDMSLQTIYFSNTEELATGQGDNKGVLIEIDTKGIRGQLNTRKPTWELAYSNGAAEFVARHNTQRQYMDAVKSITIKKGASGPKAAIVRIKMAVENGWTKNILDNGDVKYTKNEVKSSRRGAQQETQEVKRATRTSNIPGSVLENKNLEPESSETVKLEMDKGTYDYTVASNARDMEVANARLKSMSTQSAADIIRNNVNDGKRFTSADMAFVEAALLKANKLQDKTLFKSILADLRIISTEMGQSIQILGLLNKLTPEGRYDSVKRMVDVVQENLDKKARKKGKPGSDVKIVIDPALGDALLNSETPTETKVVEDLIRKSVGEQIPATVADKLNAWRYMSMLGNVKTHLRNIGGNSVMYLLAMHKDLYGAVVESSAAAMGKKMERSKSIHNPFSERARKARDFAAKDADLMMGALQGEGKESNLNEARQIFKTKWLEWLRVHSFGLLETEDKLFLSANYRKAMTAYMLANKLTPDMMAGETLNKARAAATREAQRNTFRDASALADALNSFVRRNPAAGLLVEGIVPFKRTPINVLKRGADYTPIGLFTSVYNVAKGKTTPAQFIDGVAASISGTGVIAFGFWLASLGLIRASGEPSDKEEYFEQTKGYQRYSLNIGKYSMTIDWMNPANIPLFMGVELYKMMESTDEAPSIAQIVNALSTVADPLTEMSMLQGINNALGSFKSDEKLGAIGSILESSVYGYLGQYVPTLWGQVARTLDKYRRTTYSAKDSEWTKAGETFARKVASKTPGLSHLLQPYVNVWGDIDQEGKNWAMRFIENAILPWYGNKIDDADPVNMEIEKLYSQTSNNALLPKYPETSYYSKDDKKTYYIQSDEISDYRIDYGKTAYGALEGLFKSRNYKTLSDEDKAAVISSIYGYASAYAKDESSLPYKMSDALQQASNADMKGIDIDQYFLIRQLAKTNNETTSVSQKDAREAIDKVSGLSEEQRAWMWWTWFKEETSAKNNPYIPGYQP